METPEQRQQVLQRLMAARNWTVAEVARRCGRNHATVWRWVVGDSPIPASMKPWLRVHLDETPKVEP